MRPLDASELTPFENAAAKEWLCANGTGSFASGTVAGACLRRYHALLVAALPPPLGRMTLLARVDEALTLRDRRFDLSANRYPNGIVYPEGWRYLHEFAPWPVPTWTYRLPGEAVLIKRVFLAREKNTVYVTYTLRGETPTEGATLTLTPLVAWKDYHAQMHPWDGFPLHSSLDRTGWHVRATPDAPTLRLMLRGEKEVIPPPGERWQKAGWWHYAITEDRESERGFDAEEDYYCPAVASMALPAGKTVAFIATIEDEDPPESSLALAEIVRRQENLIRAAGAAAEDETGRDLVLAADPFLIRTPTGRTTIPAGYPWFTDWGRDTMIALPGLCLTTGRADEARDILLSFAQFVSEGMIPNRFPDYGETPDYNTVDATLWYVLACARYAEATGDEMFRKLMLPTLESIVAAHVSGTRYGIGVDTEDGLLRAGEPGTQLTWMDAKIDDWVVTPRYGKPVEINALWISALRTLADWKGTRGGRPYAEQAERAAASFREKFVRPDGRGLYDVLLPDETPDAALRPNQIIAAALPHSPLTDEQARAVLDVVTQELLTPLGLRTLSRSDPAYCGRYAGTPYQRDSAYHQGTVWPWLLGSYVDAYRRVHGADADVSALLAPLLETHLRDYGVGGIAEVFDGDAPHRPNGCPWQAWSLAELLRVR